MSLRPLSTIVSTVALSLGLAGCGGDSVPAGQVVATVNGKEITRPELNAALPKTALASSKDAPLVRNGVLDQLVMQELVVQEARRQGLDKSQEYLLASRRANDQILSSLLTRRVLQGLRTPYAQDVQSFQRANPTRFAERVVLAVNQVRFPDGTLADASLKDVHTLDGVVAALEKAGAKGERGQAAIDSATLTPQALAQLRALPAGEPFVIHENGLTIVSTITGSQSAPLTGEQADKVAMQVIQQEASRTALLKQLETLRQGAKIEYQDGFAAPKTAAPPK